MREMKDSGVPWIGEIPKGWKSAKMKHITDSLKSGGTPSSDNPCFYNDDGVAWVAIGDMVHGGGISETKKHLSQEGIADKSLTTFLPGTLLYSIYASVGKVSILSIPATINQAILAISLNESAFQDYGKYLLMAMSDYVFSLANGNTQFNLNASIVSNLPIVIPPLNEQHSIADFLDAKCAEIDSILDKTRASIEDYKKLKQSVITEAVTKGIRGKRQMKDSGVEWIGEIPKEWTCDKVVRLFETIGSGTTPKSSDDAAYVGSVNWIQSGDLNGGRLTTCKKHVNEGTLQEYSALKLYRAPFLVIAMYGASVGNTSVSTIDGCVNQACCVLKGSKLDEQYAFYAIKSIKDYLLYNAVGGGQPNIGQDTIKSSWLPLPSEQEQKEIAAYLDKKCAAIDSLITSKEALITELEAYKKSLIYEYVTGKKEVL